MSQESYSYTPPPAGPPTNGMAIGSLIASILGLTFFPTIGSIIGLVLGYTARNQIRDSAGTMGGEGLAMAGIILGWIGVGLTVIGVCLVFAFVVLGLSIPGITICAGLGNNF
jgi:hypothetical protein